jgi:small subunit ribosomal protein S24e
MEIKITGKKDDLFFNRTLISVEVDHKNEATPKRADVRKALAAALNTHADLVVIRVCKSQFGFKAKCKAMLYKTKEDLQKYEPKYVIGRETGQKLHKVKTAAAPAAAK